MKQLLLTLIIAFFSLSLFSCASRLQKTELGTIDSDGMVVVPKGWFYMGYDEGEFNEVPEHDVFLETYRIDRYEVSAKDFAAFLNEKGNADERYFSCGQYATIRCLTKEGMYTDGKSGEKIVRFEPRTGYENFPASNVSWHGADSFCRWKGKRLPSEAEWEKAARGGDRRLYPWGDDYPDDRSSRYNEEWEKKGLDVLLPVNALPEGLSYYGLYHMAGNVLEWINDWYRQNYCNFCDPNSTEYIATASELLGLQGVAVDGEENNLDIPPRYNTEGPPIGSFKVLRGGSWYDKSNSKIRSSYRFWLDPLERYGYTGFRCAGDERDIEQPAAAPEGFTGKIEAAPLEEYEEKVAFLPVDKVTGVRPVPTEVSYFDDIYFDFDKYNVLDNAKPTLMAVTDWLLRNSGAVIVIEGHCDERGTAEYNLALGERRAQVIREYLMSMGISAERMGTISYGEERPLCRERSRTCWQKNRRVHFVIKDSGGPGMLK